MGKTLKDIGEFGLIDLIQRQAPRSRDTLLGIGDDAAVIAGDSQEDILSATDTIVEGIHFSKGTPAPLIGRKALACNLSDIAAMGGWPLVALVSLGVSAKRPVAFIRSLYRGMNDLARRYKMGIVGGDTVKSKQLFLNVTVLGKVERGRAVTRAGARGGDVIFVTGPLGRSLALKKHLTFEPRVQQARFLMRYFPPTAMIDISDGLLADLGHILQQSRAGAVVYTHQIPRARGATLRQALTDGEDYELLFTLPPDLAERVIKRQPRPQQFFPIGQIVEPQRGVILLDKKARRLKLPGRGYTHF